MAIDLHVVAPPKLSESVRADAVETLERVLAEAKAGNVSGVVILWRDAKEHWENDHTALADFPDWVGRIEITKAEMISEYLKQGS
jgi:hypothetical protein